MSKKSKVKITEVKLNSDGVRELLKSSEVQSECMKHANRALASLSEGYEVAEKNYPERSGAIVKATTYDAGKDNSENNSLAKAVFGG